MYQQIKKLCFRKFFYSIIIILCLFVCKGNLWAYNRFSEPSVQASWSLADTKPEKLPLPKTKMRVNRVESDIKLRLYNIMSPSPPIKIILDNISYIITFRGIVIYILFFDHLT